MSETLSGVSVEDLLQARYDRARNTLLTAHLDGMSNLPSDLGGDDVRSYGHKLRQFALHELDEISDSANWFEITLKDGFPHF